MDPFELRDWYEMYPRLSQDEAFRRDGKFVAWVTGRSQEFRVMSWDDAEFWYGWLTGALAVYGPVIWPELVEVTR